MRSLLVVAALLLSPLAQAGPGFIPIQGVLTDANGLAIDGQVDVTFTLFNNSGASISLWSDSFTLDVVDGAFATELGGGNIPLQLETFANYPTAHLQIQVESDTPMTLIPLDHVPYAAWAEKSGDASLLNGLSLGDIRAEIPAASDLEQAARDVAYDTETELTDDLNDNYLYSSGTGISIVNNVVSADQTTIEGWCYHTEAELHADIADEYTYTGGTGVSINGSNVVSVDQATIEGWAYNTEAELHADIADDYTYTGGTGVNISNGNVVSLNQSTVEGWAYNTEAELTGALDDNYLSATAADEFDGVLTATAGSANSVAIDMNDRRIGGLRAIEMNGTGFQFYRYRFSRTGNIITLIDYSSSTTTTLDASTGGDNTTVVNTDNTIAVRNVDSAAAGFSELYLNIESSGSRACTLGHLDDDTAREVFYAVDGGNDAAVLGTTTRTFRFQTVEQRGYAITNNAAFEILCF